MVHRDGNLEGLSIMIIVSWSPMAGSQLESGFMHAGLSYTGIKAIGLGVNFWGQGWGTPLIYLGSTD